MGSPPGPASLGPRCVWPLVTSPSSPFTRPQPCRARFPLQFIPLRRKLMGMQGNGLCPTRMRFRPICWSRVEGSNRYLNNSASPGDLAGEGGWMCSGFGAGPLGRFAHRRTICEAADFER